MIARPLPRFFKLSFDISLELAAIDPPDSAAPNFYGGQLPRSDHGICLRDAHIEIDRDLVERKETLLDPAFPLGLWMLTPPSHGQRVAARSSIHRRLRPSDAVCPRKPLTPRPFAHRQHRFRRLHLNSLFSLRFRDQTSRSRAAWLATKESHREVTDSLYSSRPERASSLDRPRSVLHRKGELL